MPPDHQERWRDRYREFDWSGVSALRRYVATGCPAYGSLFGVGGGMIIVTDGMHSITYVDYVLRAQGKEDHMGNELPILPECNWFAGFG